MHRLYLLGRVDFLDHQGNELRTLVAQPRRLALVAYLAASAANGACRRDKLLGLFWPELTQDRGRKALNKSVHFLRQALGEDAIVSRNAEEVGIDRNWVWCDAVAFNEALETGRTSEALELYRGELLPSFYIEDAAEFDAWMESERNRLRRLAARAAHTLAQERESDGQLTTAVSLARRAVDLAEEDERAVRQLLELLDRRGDRAGALYAYDKFARRLSTEFGAEPAAETKALIERVRARSEPGIGGIVRGAARPVATPEYTPHSERSIAAAFQAHGYRIERELGRGGMATVYLAHDLKHDRRVALKVLSPEVGALRLADRFAAEIRVTARLNHPNILPLFDSGSADGLLYYAMPCVEGESLRARLQREGQLPVDEAVRLISALAGALEHAHTAGVVHRDIKPENILLQDSQAMLADFGIALALSSAGVERITSTGRSLGTPQYMSPEQAAGKLTVGPASDIYSLAAVAYEMLAGEPPFTGPNAQAVLARVMLEPPRPIRTIRRVPVVAESAILKALAKHPVDRFASAAAFASALQDAAGTAPAWRQLVQPRRVARAAEALSALAMRPLVFVLAAVLLLALVTGVRAWRSSSDAPPRARIVVAPFANETGDKAFDDLGKVIAGWAQDALTQTGAVDVADFRALTIAPAGAALLSTTIPSDNKSLADAAGASLVLHGIVFKVGDSLEIRARVIDARSGTVRASIPPVRASVGVPMEAVNQIARRAAGALATMFNAQAKRALSGTMHVPTYGAYREFSAGMEAYQIGNFEMAGERFKAAIAQDSAFASATLWLSAAFANSSPSRLRPTEDSILAILSALDRRRSELSELDRAVLDYMLALPDGAFEKQIVAMRRAAAIWPDRWTYNLGNSLNHAGRPRETIALFETIDPTEGFMRGWAGYWLVYLYSYLLLGDFEGASEVASRARQQYPTLLLTLCFQGVALTGSGRVAEADSLMNAMLPGAEATSYGQNEAWCRRFLARTAVYFLPQAQQRPILESSLQYFELRVRDSSMARSHAQSAVEIAMWMGDTTRFVAYYDTLRPPRIPTRVNLLVRSYARALAHDRPGAERFRSAALATPLDPFDRGGTEHWLARIDLALGDVQTAARHASEARTKGRSVDGLHLDPALRQLREHPVFEALVKR